MLSGVQAHQVASVACTLLCVCVVCSASMSPASKRSKLDELASLRSRIPFISQSALSSILKIAATEGLPAITTRRGVREARDKSVGITMVHCIPTSMSIRLPSRYRILSLSSGTLARLKVEEVRPPELIKDFLNVLNVIPI